MYSMKTDDVAGSGSAAPGRDRISLTPRFTTMVILMARAFGGGRVDAFQHFRDGKIDVIHRAKGRVVERIETHGDARRRRSFAHGRMVGVSVEVERRLPGISTNRSIFLRSGCRR